ncbi:Cell shape-determining protein MreC [[Clostridium] ultunense Esp]|uniref:Cell shape-determining protein MreC n=1 Tax=[Clostridium] ultunense Esp TaxID=1288971 RepID=M1ZIF6_9FIRM|nr:rod shape-determining protein MreC [Schnuerera ultunensis]CCQ98389.1 Cell shape-determining protein MreC [[Clostridium] ultunense Esp]SHD77949.1 Cell shape-determining protein MreC [[Clostridium] ultunense Esp]
MFFFKKYKNRMIVTIVAIILIVIIGITSSERVGLSKMEKIVGDVMKPLEKVFFNLGKKTSNFFGSIKDIGSLREENENLKLKIAEMEEKNRAYEDLIGKSEYLKNEKELMENTIYNLINAQVIGKEPGNWFDRFTIDKGSKDGIKKGDTVIQAIETDEGIIQEGIVGRIAEVGDNWSKVVSVIDENSKISFKVIRTQDGGMISGSVDGRLSGYLFDNKADIMKGDKLFSSGLGGIYMKDLYIGEITDVIKKDESLTKQIEIEPAVDFKKLYKVFIITD